MGKEKAGILQLYCVCVNECVHGGMCVVLCAVWVVCVIVCVTVCNKWSYVSVYAQYVYGCVVCVCLHTRVSQSVYRGQRTTFWSQFCFYLVSPED